MPEALLPLRRKIRAVRGIEHITRAMQMVAAARLQRLQRGVAAGHSYTERLLRLLEHLAAAEQEPLHPYLAPREVNRVLLVVMAGDRGLCGAFNQQLFRTANQVLGEIRETVQVITVGDRTARWARRAGLEVVATYSGGGGAPGQPGASRALGRHLRALYDRGEVDLVRVVYQEFISVLRHRSRVAQLLPLPTAAGAAVEEVWYEYEPPYPELLAKLLPRALDALASQMALGTQAAEQAARMTAMRAAADNAAEMITGLTRQFNRIRQYRITSEIMDVVGGASALGAA